MRVQVNLLFPRRRDSGAGKHQGGVKQVAAALGRNRPSTVIPKARDRNDVQNFVAGQLIREAQARFRSHAVLVKTMALSASRPESDWRGAGLPLLR